MNSKFQRYARRINTGSTLLSTKPLTSLFILFYKSPWITVERNENKRLLLFVSRNKKRDFFYDGTQSAGTSKPCFPRKLANHKLKRQCTIKMCVPLSFVIIRQFGSGISALWSRAQRDNGWYLKGSRAGDLSGGVKISPQCAPPPLATPFYHPAVLSIIAT